MDLPSTPIIDAIIRQREQAKGNVSNVAKATIERKYIVTESELRAFRAKVVKQAKDEAREYIREQLEPSLPEPIRPFPIHPRGRESSAQVQSRQEGNVTLTSAQVQSIKRRLSQAKKAQKKGPTYEDVIRRGFLG